MIATSYTWLLNIWNMSSTIEKLNFSIFKILIDLNLNIQLAASILDNVVLDVKEVFSERM